jgi:endogenous inhibitor of DNA gyrase (YacG/DUF329 family)
MIRLSSPCPACGHPWVWALVIDLPPSNGHAEKGAARECAQCGAWSIEPLPARRAS